MYQSDIRVLTYSRGESRAIRLPVFDGDADFRLFRRGDSLYGEIFPSDPHYTIYVLERQGSDGLYTPLTDYLKQVAPDLL